MEDMKNYAYTLFRTIPLIITFLVDKGSCFFVANARLIFADTCPFSVFIRHAKVAAY